jgi:hypothetical protein
MSNPHPTKSKPCKIGRKHTNAPSARVKAKKAKSIAARIKIKNGKNKKKKQSIAAYYRGEIENFPTS